MQTTQNTPAQAAGGIDPYVNANKIELMYFKRGDISNLSRRSLKLVHKFT